MSKRSVLRLGPLVAAVALLTAAAVACAAPAADRPTPSAVFTGPVTGGKLGIPFSSMDPAFARQSGYVEEEYFASGGALNYAVTQAPADGTWTMAGVDTADYTTRLLVRRPADMTRFSGTVVVEWFNVTGGIDVDPDFGFLGPQLVANGDIYVGVSAQKVGVDDPLNISLGGVTVQGLKQWDPIRYAVLHHPGDQYSFDIYSQVGQALKSPLGADPLHGSRPRKVIAIGESQSAGRLYAYYNGVQPLAKVYDAVIIHSRGGFAMAGFDSSSVAFPPVALVRDDLTAPVLQFETETDLQTLGFLAARQPDSDSVRTWEVAGTAHADKVLLDYQAASVMRSFPGASDVQSILGCTDMNDGPQQYVMRRALLAVESWVDGGAPPAHGEPLQFAGTTLQHDAHGNALGGIRTPAVDAPIATYSGVSSAANPICALFGSTTPFDHATLARLYPTHADYVAAVRAASRRAVQRGFLTTTDADAIVARAAAASIP